MFDIVKSACYNVLQYILYYQAQLFARYAIKTILIRGDSKMKKIKENWKLRKAAVFLVLASFVAQGLTGCSINPSDKEKEEARREVSQVMEKIEEEIESELSEARQEASEFKKDLLGESDEKEKSGDYQTKAEEISAFILENSKIFGTFTIQYALMDGDKIVLSNMVSANDAWKKPVFNMASSSKMYATAAVMILVDRGDIDLDTPLVQYMPEFTMADARYKEITPRMLLNHTSGIYGTTALYGNSMSLGAPSTLGRDAFLEYKKTESLKADPGEIAVYCNDGTIMAEFLVEEVSGLTYTDFIKENISKPLGLTYTTTGHDPELKKENIAPGLTPTGELAIEYMNYPGTGGMYATTEEMCKFARLYMGAYPEILSKESAELTFEKEFAKGIWVGEDVPNAMTFGLGWDDVLAGSFDKYGIRAVSKGGDASFHHADLTVLPDHNISMAVLTSGGSAITNGMISTNVILEYLYSKGIIDSIQEDVFTPVAPVKADMPEDLKKYEGLYGTGTANGRSIQITLENGELIIPEGLGGLLPKMTFVYTGDGEFTRTDGAAFVYFKEETNGETYLIQRAYHIFPGLGEAVLEGHEFQKLEPQQLSETIKSAWQAREGKQYFLVNEMYNSSNYLSTLKLIENPEIDLENGYARGNKIIDETKAVNAVKIPVIAGRDNFDFNFYTKNGKNYLNKSNLILISEEHIVPFEITDGKNITIGTNGDAEWFTIDADTAGKEVVVSIPEKSSVFIYNEQRALSGFSMDSGKSTFTIPSGGFIVFVGDAGTEFELA